MQLIIGTAQFDNNYGIIRKNRIDTEIASNILNNAYKLGVKIVDTAFEYKSAHQIIGKNKNSFVVHTKIKNIVNPEDTLNLILSQLNRNTIDLLYIHDSSLINSPVGDFSQILKFQGQKFSKLGISVYTLEEFDKSVKLGIFQVIQIPLNLLDRRFNSQIRSVCKDRGIELIARSIFLQGLLTFSHTNLPHQFSFVKPQFLELERIANEESISLPELALRWILSQIHLDGLIVGIESVQQLEEIIKIAKNGKLREKVLSEIETVEVDNVTLLDPRTWMARK